MRLRADALKRIPDASTRTSALWWLVSRATTAWLLIVAFAASPTHAQTTGRDTVPVLLDTVFVTALRAPFDAIRAPYSVAVVHSGEIQRARPGLALDEALRGVPGVQVDNRYNYALGERISIRGFGARAQFGVRGVKVLLDGIPATLPDGQTTLNQVDLGALSRVEVLRGPASALYGNAAGGVILLESEVPRGAEEVRLGRVTLSPFVGVSNLLDAEYNTSVVVDAFGRRFYEPGPGRGLYAGAEVRL